MRLLKIFGAVTLTQLLAGCAPPSIACSTDSAKMLVGWLARNQLQATDRSTNWRNAAVVVIKVTTLSEAELKTSCSALVSFKLAPEDAIGKPLASLDRTVKYELSRTSDSRLYAEVAAYD